MNHIIEVLLLLLIAISVHELSHYIYVKLTGDYVKMDFDQGSPTVHFLPTMDKKHQVAMYLSAIFMGMLVIIPFIFLSTNGMVHIGTLIIYLIGCKYDIYQICQLYKT